MRTPLSRIWPYSMPRLMKIAIGTMHIRASNWSKVDAVSASVYVVGVVIIGMNVRMKRTQKAKV